MSKFGMRALATVVATGLVSVLALSGVGGAATAGADQGVTDKSVKIGFIYSKTGVASATSGTSDIGCKARVARENAAGGVNGRKIEVVYVDDQSSGANKTAAQDLVQNQHVFMVVNDSAFAFLTYQFLLDEGVPLIGGGYDGTYYGDTRERADHLRVRERGAGHGRHLRHHREDHEGAGREEGGVARLRHLAVVVGVGEVAEQVRGSRGRSRGGVHEHHRRLRQHRRRPAGAGDQERGRRRGVLRDEREHEPGDRAGSQAERREHEGAAHGHRLRPVSARPADREPARALGHLHAAVGAGRGEDQGHQAVPGRPQEVRRLHRRARLRGLHRLHRLRPGHHRAQGAGQEPRPEHLRRRPAQARQGQPGRARLPAHRHQRRDLRPAGADDLQLGDDRQGRQVRRPLAQGR